MKASDLFNLGNRVALVAGEASGRNQQFARMLLDNGASVALVTRSAEALRAIRYERRKSSAQFIAIEADFNTRDDMVRAFDEAEKALGIVTILVINASAAQCSAPVTHMMADEWRRVMSMDMDIVFYWAQEGARRMIAAKKKGSIVNIASARDTDLGATVYSAAKAGVIQLTKVLALELAANGVRVNAIAPGRSAAEPNGAHLNNPDTAMLPDATATKVSEIGSLDGALLLLASEAGAFMTGATVVVDGGQAMESEV